MPLAQSALVLILSVAWLQSPQAEPVEFVTEDGITVYGDLYRSQGSAAAPVILLFHQGGGDARGEYQPLVGRLLEAGFHTLAIDQRRGGTRLGGRNRTVAALGDREYSYCEAMPDLRGALGQVGRLGLTGPVVLWGSSYSASLAIRLAAEVGLQVAAVLAFSPASGGPMQECPPDEAAAGLEVPLLTLRPSSEMEIESARAQMGRFAGYGHQTYVADPAVHGSSMLNPERVGASTEGTWEVVLHFLRRHAGPAQARTP